MATRIALISANRHREPYPVYPLGTAYLKAYLLANLDGCCVEVLDMNVMSDAELHERLRTTEPDYVCMSIRNVDGANSLDRRGFLDDYKRIVECVRGATSAPLIAGGSGFSIFPELFMRELGADYGIRGEGEQALCDLIRAIGSGADAGEIPRVYTPRHGNRCGHGGYIASPQAVYEPSLAEYYWKQSGMLNIQTKRGCPYDCIYCTYPQIDGRCVRTMDVGSIVDTIARAKRDFGANYWFFTDSVFNIGGGFNELLAEALIKSGLNISWGAYFTPCGISDAQMSLYSRSGLTHIEFGTESFCDATLEAYGKRFTFGEALECSELALKHNVYYSHFLILAGWGEDRERLGVTIENSKRLRHTVIFPYVGMRIYPGTALHRRSLEEGVVSADDDLVSPKYYIAKDFDLPRTMAEAERSGKAWVFPDSPQDEMVRTLKLKRNKKGPLWEYLRRP